jgi:hypothetical protein
MDAPESGATNRGSISRKNSVTLALSSIYHVSWLNHGIEPTGISLVEKTNGFSFPAGDAGCVCELG